MNCWVCPVAVCTTYLAEIRRTMRIDGTDRRAIYAKAVFRCGKTTQWLRRQGHAVNPKRICRLMRQMGLEAIYPHRRRGLSTADKQHNIYPYLLKSVAVTRPDQGSQFTSVDIIVPLKKASVQISMDGKGRVFDNIFVERLWRTVKVEEVYLRDYQPVVEVTLSLGRYFEFYNHQRLHEALGCRSPAEVYGVAAGPPVALVASSPNTVTNPS